ncbi:predicted protein [Nematostella vectensis]|uniref:Sodium/glutamate symporter n=1 Tax=Nematostella vectensis TaxID=45351 RepID=A7RFG4_NEMVE|nr:uncharacterized protein LOC5521887 [Nematostella vectensis]EDO49714.1 predicted protein [Nematostella vectensis]|eukprot:XP_001641777.1 predicted protein [Nematostella vectensis]
MSCNASVSGSCGTAGVCVAKSDATACLCPIGYELVDGICTAPEKSLPYAAVASFCWLCFLLVLGKFLRLYCWIFQKLYLPASVIGGIVGLVILQLANLDPQVSGFIKRNFTLGWYNLAGFLINIVFSSLFLGTKIPNVKVIWNQAGPQLMYGMLIAWGQWTVALVVTAALLIPVFDVSPLFASVLPIGFAGGHGTAGGLTQTYKKLGFENGGDFGLASATLGLVFSVICGVMWVNIATYRGWVKQERIDTAQDVKISIRGVYAVGSRPLAGIQTVRASSIDVLALHIAILGIAMLFGYGCKLALVFIESTSDKLIELNFLSGIPLFPLCMAGGIVLQLIIERVDTINELVDASLMERISSSSLDFLITAAVSTVDIRAVAVDIGPLLILCGCGFLWNFLMLGVFARYLLPNHWFERAIADFGMNTGVIATGLVLLRMVDPESKTPVAADFAFKQLLHSPFMGGGVWTCLALPLLHVLNIWIVLAIAASVFSLWLLSFFFYFRKRYTGMCGCSLCAIEKPRSYSRAMAYCNLPPSHRPGGGMEEPGMDIDDMEMSGKQEGAHENEANEKLTRM